MHKLLFLTAAVPLLFSCTTYSPSFARMSNEEIALYNSSVEFDQQVVCVREVRAGTHIKRRYCETFEEMERRRLTNIGKLNAANVGSVAVFTTD